MNPDEERIIFEQYQAQIKNEQDQSQPKNELDQLHDLQDLLQKTHTFLGKLQLNSEEVTELERLRIIEYEISDAFFENQTQTCDQIKTLSTHIQNIYNKLIRPASMRLVSLSEPDELDLEQLENKCICLAYEQSKIDHTGLFEMTRSQQPFIYELFLGRLMQEIKKIPTEFRKCRRDRRAQLDMYSKIEQLFLQRLGITNSNEQKQQENNLEKQLKQFHRIKDVEELFLRPMDSIESLESSELSELFELIDISDKENGNIELDLFCEFQYLFWKLPKKPEVTELRLDMELIRRWRVKQIQKLFFSPLSDEVFEPEFLRHQSQKEWSLFVDKIGG